MRNAVGLFGLVCGAIVVALVARYGFKTTDVEADAWIMAFFFGAIASFALGGHAVAVRLWSSNKFWSVAAGFVAVVALGLNLTNSLGAIAGRADKVQTAATEHNRKIKGAEAELKRLQGLRAGMPSFDFADQATVDAAKRAADAATKSREAECKNRGNLCRDREADERTAADKLAAAARNKAASERATRLESEIAAQSATITKLGSPTTINVQGGALAKLFRLPDDEAGFVSTAQQFGTAAIVEMIILICFVFWEVDGRKHEGREKAQNLTAQREIEVQAVVTPPPVAALPAPVSEPARTPDRPSAPVVPQRPRPRLAVANKRPVGAVLDFLAEGCKIVAQGRTETAAAYLGYVAWCKASDLRAMSVEAFAGEIYEATALCGIKTSVEGDFEFLLNVQLVDIVEKTA